MYNMCNIIFIKLLNIYNKEIYHIIVGHGVLKASIVLVLGNK